MSAPPTIPETDFSLLRRFAEDGDEDAFSEIVRRYAGVVFSACHRVLRDRGAPVFLHDDREPIG